MNRDKPHRRYEVVRTDNTGDLKTGEKTKPDMAGVAFAAAMLLLGKGLNVIPNDILLVLALGLLWFGCVQRGYIQSRWITCVAYGLLLVSLVVLGYRGRDQGRTYTFHSLGFKSGDRILCSPLK